MTSRSPARISAAVLATATLTMAVLFMRTAKQPVYGEVPLAAVFAGTVTDGTGAPVANAAVHVMPWGAGGLTDEAGRYAFTARGAMAGERATITVRSIGYGNASRDIRVQGDTTRTDFRLEVAKVELDELVVTGDAAQQKSRRLDSSANIVAAPPMGARIANEAVRADPRFNTESYAAIGENGFLAATGNPLSTFSIDVDRASYANVRRFLREGRLPPVDAVRVEELVNYFTYDDPTPDGRQPFSVTTELGVAPWRPEHRLLRIGLKARAIETDRLPRSNLVFLIDVSGSMQSPDKLPLLKQAFGLLVDELRENDRVAIVVYAGAAGVVLEPTAGDRKEVIRAALERLEAGGSTAGGAGIRLAYDVAKRHHVEGGNNRVILATDGDFNIGASSDAEMMRLIEEKREQGTFLTVLGFGTGNLKDSKMELIADRGNGNYAYIDDIGEARKVLVHEMGGTLFAVAKDVKLQVEFNPAIVRGYRLIGYENRLLAAEDFNDDRKDAGELGAGHSVTALYEIVPVGSSSDVEIRSADPLRYQAEPAAQRSDARELAFVRLRYKAPDGSTSRLIEVPVRNRETRTSADFTFSAAVASFGMLLRESPHRGQATFGSVLALARDGLGEDRGGYRHGFIELVEQADRIARRVASGSND